MSDDTVLLAVDTTRVTLIASPSGTELSIQHPRGEGRIALTPDQAETLARAAPGGDGATEIERKLLVEPPLPFEIDTFEHWRLRQGYIVASKEATLRVRERSSGHHRATIKRGAGLERIEVQVDLSAEQASLLWTLAGDMLIDKVRYFIPGTEDHPLELDVYHGAHAGLMVLEQEFPSVEAANRWEPPAWAGREVTDDPAFTNAQLARLGVPESASS